MFTIEPLPDSTKKTWIFLNRNMIKPLLRRHSISTAAQFFEPAPSPTRAVIHQVLVLYILVFIKILLCWKKQQQCLDESHCFCLLQEPTTKKICAVSNVSNMPMLADSSRSPDPTKKGILVQVCQVQLCIIFSSLFHFHISENVYMYFMSDALI